MKALRGEAGFSLIEVLVVLLIIGLISTVVVINVLPALDNSRKDKARIDVQTLSAALEQYKLDNYNYPRTADGLNALVAPPADLARPDRYRQGGYIPKLPLDPWGNPYQYAFPGRNGLFDVYSFGADGAPGGEGQNADIGSWQP
ncbi:MAG: type II secretion system major pseudopilin GspG [Hyphomonadaceae bacterium]